MDVERKNDKILLEWERMMQVICLSSYSEDIYGTY